LPAQTARQPTRAVDPEEEEQSHLGRIIAIVLGIMLVIALVAVGLVWAFNRTPEIIVVPTGPSVVMVQVPHVISMNEDVAVRTLESKNLKADVVYVEGPDDLTVGTVLTQFPEAGTMLEPGKVVKLEVNRGPEKIEIPNVVGKTTEEAMSILTPLFASVDTRPATAEGPNDVPGTVLQMQPAAGGKATRDQVIILFYATGEVKLPNLIGYTERQALMDLATRGFKDSQIHVVYEQSTQPEGIVIKMEPPPLDNVARDTEITLTVAIPIPPPAETTTPPPPDETEDPGDDPTGR